MFSRASRDTVHQCRATEWERRRSTKHTYCCVTVGGRGRKDEVYSNSLVDSLSRCHYWESLVGWDQSQQCTTSATRKELTCHKQTKSTCLRHNKEVDFYCGPHTLLLFRENFPKTKHKAMEYMSLNAIRKPGQAILDRWFLRERPGMDVWEECGSYSLRGLVEDLVRNEWRWSACNGNYWSDSRKLWEIVWTARKQRVRTCGSFWGVAGKEAWVFSRSVIGEVEDGDQRCETESCVWSRRKSGVDVGKAVGDWVLLWLVSSAPSGYGEDGVHSREAAEKNRRQKRF